MRFRIQLEQYAGPLDLLLYLVRKHELDALQIPIARVVDQYLQIVEALEVIDVDAAGDFLETATVLMEIKSRDMLPRHEEVEEGEAAIEDPRQDLVERLLQFKRFKHAANLLEERGQRWQRRYARRDGGSDETVVETCQQPLAEVPLWDLVSALGRVMRRKKQSTPAKIRYDDTPIEVHMQRIEQRVVAAGRLEFASLFEAGMHRSQLAGLFLGLLELIRHRRVRVAQAELFETIWIEAAPVAAGPRGVSPAPADHAPADHSAAASDE
jgi:segregation and condensation protein A